MHMYTMLYSTYKKKKNVYLYMDYSQNIPSLVLAYRYSMY